MLGLVSLEATRGERYRPRLVALLDTSATFCYSIVA